MASILGGILLILGAYYTMKGNVYRAVMIYMIADVCWIFLGIAAGNYLGVFFIVIGTIMGIVAFVKMHYNVMDKKLKHNKE